MPPRLSISRGGAHASAPQSTIVRSSSESSQIAKKSRKGWNPIFVHIVALFVGRFAQDVAGTQHHFIPRAALEPWTLSVRRLIALDVLVMIKDSVEQISARSNPVKSVYGLRKALLITLPFQQRWMRTNAQEALTQGR